MEFEKVTRILKQNMLTIPMEIRNEFDLEENKFVKWIVDGNNVITIKPLELIEK